jgi:hypothetical protein
LRGHGPFLSVWIAFYCRDGVSSVIVVHATNLFSHESLAWKLPLGGVGSDSIAAQRSDSWALA